MALPAHHMAMAIYGGGSIVQTLGALMPQCFSRMAAVKEPPGSLCDPAYCSSLDDARERALWEIAKNRVSTRIHGPGFWDLKLSLPSPAPEPGRWCCGALPWMRECLDLFNAVERPEVLAGVRIEELSDSLQLGGGRLIALLLFIERAWSSPVDLQAGLRSALSADEDPDDDEWVSPWPEAELAPRCAALLDKVGGDLPTIDDLRFWRMLEGVCKVGQSVEAALKSIVAGECRAAVDDQIRLVDALARAANMTVVEEIKSVGAVLVRRVHEPGLRQRNLQIFCQRYGADGLPACELEAVAKLHGMTRERIRQIVEKISEATRGATIWAPATGPAVAAYAQLLPARKEVIEAREDMRAMLGPGLGVRSLDLFAREVIGHAVPVTRRSKSLMTKRLRGLLVKNKKDERLAAVVHKWAVKCVSHIGAAQCDLVSAFATREINRPVTQEMVVRLLGGSKDFEWLHEPTGWFWLGQTGNNRLESQLERILSVAQRPIPLETLFGGLVKGDRDKRWSSARENVMSARCLPTQLVLLALCRRLPFATVNGHQYVSASDTCRKPEEVLGPVQLAIYKAMADRGGLARRSEVRKATIDSGICNKNTFEVMFGDSPFIANIGHDVYGLRGWMIDPKLLSDLYGRIAADEAARQTKRSSERGGNAATIQLPQPTRDLESGQYSWSFSITELMLRNYIVPIPGRVGLAGGGLVQVQGVGQGSAEIVRDRVGRGGYRIKGLMPLLRGKVAALDCLDARFDYEKRVLHLEKREAADGSVSAQATDERMSPAQ